MQSGELLVTGKNSINIPLTGMPSSIRVHFKHEFEVIPCNPQNVDSLEYVIHTTNTLNSGFMLVVQWNVTGVREIVWHVYY